MRSPTRTTAAALAVAAVASTGILTASPASAASYKCKASKASIDTANYSGPWADQWNVTTTLCAKRSGSTVYGYAKVSWDGPVFAAVDDSTIFDGARFRLQLKRSQSGTDPVKVSKNYTGIEAKLENSNSAGNYNGSYTTGTITWKAGSSKGLADGVLQLDWRRCCGGYHSHNFSASPVV
ncbi:hypothetical protein EES45_36220 [Streptomyces sp. ADI97-07]|uniref:hypothetical protein n=1 Tax=Streptomyces sp. ADI97-07 TaxID=1522762 RepID=UPI000F559276|nr:hypothetical protein [Streptomyces sp. ADI97-07]RPK69968.1 hypothetical protein EES45_36220 [Streptomyces sp. ADI97-07]